MVVWTWSPCRGESSLCLSAATAGVAMPRRLASAGRRVELGGAFELGLPWRGGRRECVLPDLTGGANVMLRRVTRFSAVDLTAAPEGVTRDVNQ